MIDIEQTMAMWREQHVDREEQRLRAIRERAEFAEKRLLDRIESRERNALAEVTEAVSLIDGEFIPTRLGFWLKHDTWSANEGLAILSDFDPSTLKFEGVTGLETARSADNEDALHDYANQRGFNGPIRLDGLRLHDKVMAELLPREFREIQTKLELDNRHLTMLWNSGSHLEPRYAPSYFIRWAETKKIEISWLRWAIDSGLYRETSSNNDVDVKPEKELATREKNTLLRLVAVLCESAGLDYTKSQSKAALALCEASAIRGQRIGETTIEEILKKVHALVGNPPEKTTK